MGPGSPLVEHAKSAGVDLWPAARRAALRRVDVCRTCAMLLGRVMNTRSIERPRPELDV